MILLYPPVGRDFPIIRLMILNFKIFVFNVKFETYKVRRIVNFTVYTGTIWTYWYSQHFSHRNVKNFLQQENYSNTVQIQFQLRI
jgi:hypothetical protein